MVRKITQVPPLRTNVKASFNIQPSATTVPATESPSAQDIKDGHARLRPMSKFLYQVCYIWSDILYFPTVCLAVLNLLHLTSLFNNRDQCKSSAAKCL